MSDTNWTVAYRRLFPEPEPLFHRVDLEVPWREASGHFTRAYLKTLGDDYEVWYVPSRAAELTDYVTREDVMNVLTFDDTRIPIADDGKQLEELG